MRILITGSNSGFGKLAALTLARQGHHDRDDYTFPGSARFAAQGATKGLAWPDTRHRTAVALAK